jgi:hypothetical protein
MSVVALGALAMAWAIGVSLARGYHRAAPYAEQANIARHLALGHGFSSPMDPSPTAPPSAMAAPVYPLVVAASYRVLGIASPAAVFALMLVNAVCFACIVTAIERLAARLFGSRVPGWLAAGILAVHPVFLTHIGDYWDGFLSLAMFAWLTVAAVRLGDRAASTDEIRPASAAVFGIGLGALALTNASYVACLPVLIVIAFRAPLARVQWPLAALAGAACIAVILPWSIRNYTAFGRLVTIRTGTGVQLWIGNPPVSGGWLDWRAYAVHPYINASERQMLLTLGEPSYNDLVFARFMAATRARPLGFVTACFRRTLYLVIGNPANPGYPPRFVEWKWEGTSARSLLAHTTLAILASAGIIWSRRAGYPLRGLPFLAAAAIAPFVLTGVHDRFSLPLRWVLVLYAGAALWLLWQPFQRLARAES